MQQPLPLNQRRCHLLLSRPDLGRERQHRPCAVSRRPIPLPLIAAVAISCFLPLRISQPRLSLPCKLVTSYSEISKLRISVQMVIMKGAKATIVAYGGLRTDL